MLHTIAPRGILLAAFCAAGLALAAPPAADAQPGRTTPPTSKNPGDTRGDRSKPAAPPSSALGRFLVGDAAPDVRLNDHTGRAFHLALERRTKPWLLVFIRRPEELAEVEAIGDGLHDLGLGSVVIAPFGRERVLKAIPAPKLPVLFDRASLTARTYGVYDVVTGNPRPGAFLIDQRGRIVWLISGGLPSGTELVRMTREALEASERASAEGSAN
jgi:hypothetical protein